MFTIKHVTPDGNESVIETYEVSYAPLDEPRIIPKPDDRQWASTGVVWWRSKVTSELVAIRDGDVYVMNEHGATVSRWHLGGWAPAQQSKAA